MNIEQQFECKQASRFGRIRKQTQIKTTLSTRWYIRELKPRVLAVAASNHVENRRRFRAINKLAAVECVEYVFIQTHKMTIMSNDKPHDSVMTYDPA